MRENIISKWGKMYTKVSCPSMGCSGLALVFLFTLGLGITPVSAKTVSISDFGGRCDGTTINNVALTKALMSGANVISFPSGVCVIDKFALPSNVTLQGNTDGSSKLRGQNSATVFTIKGTRASFITQVTIQNLVFVSKSSEYMPGSAIIAEYASHVVISNNKAIDVELISFRTRVRYEDLSDSDLSSDLHIFNNTCRTESRRDQCIELRFVKDAVVEQNTSHGYMHGMMYWGGDSNVATHLKDPRWVKNVTFSDNEVSDAGQGGIWGSKGENIKYLNNRISNVGDVGLDFEGTVNGYATGNICHNAKNACASAFFIGKNIVFEKNTLVQPKAAQAIARIYNATQLPENQDIEFRNNTFDCQDPTAVCTVDDSYGPATDIVFSGNHFINSTLSLTFNNTTDVHIINNTFDFTHPLAKPAVSVGSFGKNAYVDGNTITSAASMDGIPAIQAQNIDFNHNTSYFIGGNKVSGFKKAIQMKVQGTNPGTTAHFVVCSNAFPTDAQVDKPVSAAGKQKFTVADGKTGDCADNPGK